MVGMTGRVAVLLAGAALAAPAITLGSATGAAALTRTAPVAVAVPAAALSATSAALAAATVPALVTASPEIGAVLDGPPAQVVLTFDQPLASGRMVISGPNGFASAGIVTVSGNTLSKSMRDSTGTGTYTVTWRAKPAQGKAATGTYAFSVSTSTPTSSSPSPSPSTGGTGVSGGTKVSGGTATATASSTPIAGVPTGATPGSTTGPPAGSSSGPSGPSQASGTRSAPAGAQPNGSGTGTPGTSPSASGKNALASSPVGALAAKSRELGPWLIGFAVLLQVITGLYGLWRWRRAQVDIPPEANPARPTLDLTESGDEWSDDGDPDLPKLLADRPWTGELPIRRSTFS
jgi:methionine-rich copper-binding protein CopC